MIDEVPLVLHLHTVNVSCRYTTAPVAHVLETGVSPEAVERGIYPPNGHDCYWIQPPAWEALQSAGIPLYEPLHFVVEHLRHSIRRHLHYFLDTDAVDELLEERCQIPEDKLLVQDVLPSAAARFHFSRLLMALVQQAVPVVNLPEILRAIRGMDLHSSALSEPIRNVRLRLRAALPGNENTWLRAALTPELEDFVEKARKSTKDGVSWAVMMSSLREFLRGIQNEGQFPGVTLIASRYGTAEYLRRVLHKEFSDVTALSREEVYELAAAKFSTIAG